LQMKMTSKRNSQYFIVIPCVLRFNVDTSSDRLQVSSVYPSTTCVPQQLHSHVQAKDISCSGGGVLVVLW
jgi:hypothetical protein